jgi:hypothetical protein
MDNDLTMPDGRPAAAQALDPGVVATINGRHIRKVWSGRWGLLYSVQGTNLGFAQLEQAVACATDQPPLGETHG